MTTLDDFVRFRPDIEVTVFESYAGTLMRDLRDGRLDAVIASSEFGSADLRSLRLASKAWVVLVGLAHRLAAPSPIGPDELHGEPIVMTGHRDGAGHDRAVAELLESFGVTAVERRGGPGPALYAAVVAGHAVALATAAAATGRELLARPLEPARQVRFALLWRAETPAPALSERIRAARQATEAAPAASRPALASAA